MDGEIYWDEIFADHKQQPRPYEFNLGEVHEHTRRHQGKLLRISISAALTSLIVNDAGFFLFIINDQ
jgi:hypothetical protein